MYNRFVQYAGRLYISVVTLGELTIWTQRAKASRKRAQDVQDLLKIVTTLDVTGDVARKFGEIQAALMDVGQRAPDLDLLIAATALVYGYTVVTDNTPDYANIANASGLTIVDWLVP